VLRKQLFRIKETDRLPESAYTAGVNENIYETLVKRASIILVRGHSVVVDAVFAHLAERSAISEVARKLKVHFSGIFLTADLATRQQRIDRRESDASDATSEIAALQENYDIGPMDWQVVDASGTPEQTFRKCLPHVRRAAIP
jgi:predicted kinase